MWAGIVTGVGTTGDAGTGLLLFLDPGCQLPGDTQSCQYRHACLSVCDTGKES